MAPLHVHVKHAGKTYDAQLDTDLPPAAFKDAVYHLTGVPPDRMKVMIKGGMLKVISRASLRSPLTRSQDDTDWKKVAPKTVRAQRARVLTRRDCP